MLPCHQQRSILEASALAMGMLLRGVMHLQGASGKEQRSMRAIVEVSNPAEDVEALAEGCCCLVTDLSAPAKQRSTGPLLLRTSARTLWQLIPPAEAQTA